MKLGGITPLFITTISKGQYSVHPQRLFDRLEGQDTENRSIYCNCIYASTHSSISCHLSSSGSAYQEASPVVTRGVLRPNGKQNPSSMFWASPQLHKPKIPPHTIVMPMKHHYYQLFSFNTKVLWFYYNLTPVKNHIYQFCACSLFL